MFGYLLKEIMKKYKIKGKELSVYSDLTEGFISDIKKGRCLPRIENLNKILDLIPMTTEEKLKLQKKWEKERAPKSFVKRYDELEEKYNLLYSFYLKSLDKDTKKLILEIMKENELLKKEQIKLKLYKEFLKPLTEDDLIYLTNKQILLNKKMDLLKLIKDEITNNK